MIYRGFLGMPRGKIIDKARIACQTAGHAVVDHIPDVRKMVLVTLSTMTFLTILLTSTIWSIQWSSGQYQAEPLNLDC